ncbi:MAG: HAD family phosphatase [Bacteroides sp.]|nr:HAD family phosphatase [Bacteroides sp.]
MSKIKNIVFDFDGVIIGVDRESAVKAFREIGVKEADSLLGEYHQQGIFQDVEDGKVDAETFRKELSRICGKELTYKEVENGWKGFITEVPQYKLDYLNELRKKYKVYILSNTNPYVTGWARSTDFTPAGKPLDAYVDKIYTSYEAGSTKPDRGIFDHMIKDSGLNPAETLFVDDGAANITIGKELGFITLQPLNAEDWREKLEKLL